MKLLTFLGMAVFVMAGVSPALRAEHYEVFLLAGQSNMDGRGPVKDLTGSLEKYAKPNPKILIHFSAGGVSARIGTRRKKGSSMRISSSSWSRRRRW